MLVRNQGELTLDRQRFRNRREARMVVFDFIESPYNPQPSHSSLDCTSLAEFEGKQSGQAI